MFNQCFTCWGLIKIFSIDGNRLELSGVCPYVLSTSNGADMSVKTICNSAYAALSFKDLGKKLLSDPETDLEG